MSGDLEFNKKIRSAFSGMLFYKMLQKRNIIRENTFIIIQRSNDEELIDFGNKYLKEFITNNALEDVLILTSNEYKKKLGVRLGNVRRLSCPVSKADCLISLYCMYRFTKNILIVSSGVPNTNRLGRLMDSGVLNKEEAVAVGIYGLNGIER